MTSGCGPSPRERPIYGKFAEQEDDYTDDFRKLFRQHGLRPTRHEDRDLGVDVTVEAMLDAGPHGREASGVRANFQLKVAKPDANGAMWADVKKTSLAYPGRQLGGGYVAGWHKATGKFHAVSVVRALRNLDASVPKWRDQPPDEISVALEVEVTPAWLEEVRARLLRKAPLVEAVANLLSADDAEITSGSSKTLCSLIGPLNAQLAGDLGKRDVDARTLLRAGKVKEAEEALRGLLADIEASKVIYERIWAVRTNYGMALAAIRRHGEAHEQFTTAWVLAPKETATIVNLALSSMNVGELAKADELVAAVAGLERDDPAVANLIGLVASQRGRSDEAVALFRTGIELHPKFMPLYRSLASELLDRGELDAAIEVARGGVKICDDDPGLGWLEYMEGDAALMQAVATVGGTRTETAAGELEFAIAVPAGTKFELARAREAAELFRRAIARLTEVLRGAHLQLGAALCFGGQPEESIRAYEVVAEDEEYAFRAKAGIAHSLVQAGRHADALPVLGKLLALRPDLLGLLNSKAICLAETGDVAGAGEWFRAAAKHPDARDFDWRNYLGWAIQSRSWSVAEELIRERIAKEPEATLSHQSLYELGVAKEDRGVQVEGIRGFLNIKKDNVAARTELAYLELKRGNFAEAAAALDAIDPARLDLHALAAHVGALGHLGRWDDATRVAKFAFAGASSDDRRRCMILVGRTIAHRRVTFVIPGGLELPGDAHFGLPFYLALPSDGPSRRS